MNCTNCGKPIAGGQSFCSNCGMPVSPAQDYSSGGYASSQQNSAGYGYDPTYQQNSPDYGYDHTDPYGFQPVAPKKKGISGKKLAIIITAIVLVLAIGTFGVVAAVTGLFLSDAEKLHKIEKESLHKLLASTDNSSLINPAGMNGSIDLEFGQFLSSASGYVGTDLSWLKNLRFDIAAGSNGDTRTENIKLSLNGTEITTLSMQMDNSGKLLMGLDGLSNSIMSVDGSAALSSLSSANIDKAKLNALIEKYFAVVVDSIKDVKKTNGSFTANGVTENCDVYTYDVTERQAGEIAKNVCASLIDDMDFKALLEEIYPMIASGYMSSYSGSIPDFSSFYSQMQDSLRSTIDNFNDQTSHELSDSARITISEYVSSKEIHAIRATVYDINSNIIGGVFFGTAVDNSNRLGVELTYTGSSDESRTYLKGTGAKNGSKVNCDLELGDGSESFVYIKLTDWDTASNKGAMELSASYNAWCSMTDNNTAATLLSTASLKLDNSTDQPYIEALVGGQSLVKATVTLSASSGNVTFDSSKPVVDSYEWGSTLDLNTLVSRLKAAGVPQQLLDSLTPSSSSGRYLG